MAFYEPLHEELSYISLRDMPSIRPDSWHSGHPDPRRPYYEEFAPLLSLSERGVAGYDRAFAIDQYFAETDTALPGLATYIESLVQLARATAKTPVIKCCRSMGRIGWMRAAFPTATHVIVLRNPWSQWLSGWLQFLRYRNAYFLAMPLAIFTRHRAHPSLLRAAEVLKVHLGDLTADTLESRYQICANAIRLVAPEVLYRVFLALWTVTTYEGLRHAHLIVDADRLVSSPVYRSEAEDQFTTLSGIQVSLSGARASAHGDWLNDLAAGAFDVKRSHALALELCDDLQRSAGEALSTNAAMIMRAKLRDATVAGSHHRIAGVAR